jgi:hypothetical protein
MKNLIDKLLNPDLSQSAFPAGKEDALAQKPRNHSGMLGEPKTWYLGKDAQDSYSQNYDKGYDAGQALLHDVYYPDAHTKGNAMSLLDQFPATPHSAYTPTSGTAGGNPFAAIAAATQTRTHDIASGMTGDTAARADTGQLEAFAVLLDQIAAALSSTSADLVAQVRALQSSNQWDDANFQDILSKVVQVGKQGDAIADERIRLMAQSIRDQAEKLRQIK